MSEVTIKHCEICDQQVCAGNTCEHPKNSYCALWLIQAYQDAKVVNMHPAGSFNPIDHEQTK